MRDTLSPEDGGLLLLPFAALPCDLLFVGRRDAPGEASFGTGVEHSEGPRVFAISEVLFWQENHGFPALCSGRALGGDSSAVSIRGVVWGTPDASGG